MPKLIVIDCDPHEIRLLEADVRGGRVLVEKLTTRALPEGHESADAQAARDLVSQALGGSAKGGDRLVGLVGRTQAVLRDLRVPGCPDEELAGLVRFQAMRELSFPVEQAAIDYEVVGQPESDGQRRVVLAALQQDVVERYRSLVSGTRLGLSRLGLRPYATFQAYAHAVGTPHEPVLLVSVAGRVAELTIVSGSNVLFSRATLLPAESRSSGADLAGPLANEVRRTLAAFTHQAAGPQITRMAIPLVSGEHDDLVAALAAALPVAVEPFDPFQAVELAAGLRSAAGEKAGGREAFVAAIGAALSLTEPWSIDFLNPKKPVVRRDRRKPAALTAAAAVVLALTTAYFVAHQQVARGQAQIEDLVKLQNEKKDTVKAAQDVLKQYQEIEDWIAFESNCLEELRRLTKEYPDTRHMYSTKFRISRDGSAASSTQIGLEGLARERSTIYDFTSQLNIGGRYSIGAVSPTSVGRTGDYREGFSAKIDIKPATAPEEDGTEPNESDTKTAKRPAAQGASPTTRTSGVIPSAGKGTNPPTRNATQKKN